MVVRQCFYSFHQIKEIGYLLEIEKSGKEDSSVFANSNLKDNPIVITVWDEFFLVSNLDTIFSSQNSLIHSSLYSNVLSPLLMQFLTFIVGTKELFISPDILHRIGNIFLTIAANSLSQDIVSSSLLSTLITAKPKGDSLLVCWCLYGLSCVALHKNSHTILFCNDDYQSNGRGIINRPDSKSLKTSLCFWDDVGDFIVQRVLKNLFIILNQFF
jgi:hypothetical protein